MLRFFNEIAVRSGKLTVAFSSWAVVLFVSTAVGSVVTESVTGGFAFGLIVMSFTINAFLVSVPEITGLITVNVLLTEQEALNIYGTGMHFRFPCEQVKKGNFINLRQVTVSIEETYPSKDSLMLCKIEFQYTPSLEGLGRYISASASTIQTGLSAIVGSVLSSQISSRTSQEAKVDQEKIETLVKEKITESNPTPLKMYGIVIDRVSLKDLDYDAATQVALSSQKVALLVQDIAKAMRIDHPDMSGREAMDYALVIGGQVKKQIFDIPNLGPAVNAILSTFQGRN